MSTLNFYSVISIIAAMKVAVHHMHTLACIHRMSLNPFELRRSVKAGQVREERYARYSPCRQNRAAVTEIEDLQTCRQVHHSQIPPRRVVYGPVRSCVVM